MPGVDRGGGERIGKPDGRARDQINLRARRHAAGDFNIGGVLKVVAAGHVALILAGMKNDWVVGGKAKELTNGLVLR